MEIEINERADKRKIDGKVTEAKRERGKGKRKLSSGGSEYARRELDKQAAHSSEIKKKKKGIRCGAAAGATGVREEGRCGAGAIPSRDTNTHRQAQAIMR